MRAILDEGVPNGLKAHLSGHEISSVKREGWNSIKHGKLLDLVKKSGFEAFITNDKRMEREQQFHRRSFAVLLLALDSAQPREIIKVDCGKFVPNRFRRPEL